MKNNYLRLVMMLLLAVFANVVSADKVNDAVFDFYDENEVGDTIWYKITSDSTCEVTYRYEDEKVTYSEEGDIPTITVEYSDTLRYTGKIIIPSKAENGGKSYTVTGIGASAFRACIQLTSVSIPVTVTYIGNNAFENCEKLSDIGELPTGLISIGDDAFDYTNISSVTIPASVDSLGYTPFFGCENLKTLTVAEDNKSFTAESNVLFDKNMTTLVLYPVGLTNDTYPVPASVKEIEPYAFSLNSSLKEVTMSSVENIGRGAFSHCHSLSKVTLSPTLKSLDGYVFGDDTLLTSITIPASVESMESDIFEGCLNLQSITVESGNKYYATEDNVLFSKNKDTLLLYAPSLRNDSYDVPQSVKVIGKFAFLENKYLEKVTMSSVEAIENGAFEYCSSLKEITFSPTLEEIGHVAFHNDTSLTSITLPNSLKEIDAFSFWGCNSLESVDIPASVSARIFGATFNGCTSLSRITVDPNNPYYMSMDNVVFTKDTTKLLAFAQNNAITDYTIPAAVDTIEWLAFCNVLSLKKVTIPASVKFLNDGSFDGDDILSIDTIVCENTVPLEGYECEEEYYDEENDEERDSMYISKFFSDSICAHSVLVVPDGCKVLYESAYPWSLFRNIVEKSTTGIKSVTSDNIPTSVTTDERIYDLQGRRLDMMPDNGVYIKGGKKYLGN